MSKNYNSYFRKHSTKLLLGSLLFVNVICFAQEIKQSVSVYENASWRNEIKKARLIITQLIAEKKIPGLSVSVGVGNKIVWAEAFGFADLENAIPVKLNTKFRIGSLSKTLTGVGLLRLTENNRIRLDADVRTYVSSFPEKKYVIRISDLVSHTGGIRDYDNKKNEFLSNARFNSVNESLVIFKDDSLLFEPGTKYSYSTYGYVLLSAAIENATGKNFLDFMRNEVFEPIKMTNTEPDYNDSIIKNRAKFYIESKGKIINSPYVDNSNKWAGGGFLSTSLDLVKMTQSLLNLKETGSKQINILWQPARLASGQMTNYGIGWRIDTDSLNRKFVHHGGLSMGGRAFLFALPEEKIVVAITCNLSTNFDQKLCSQIAGLFLK